MRKTFLASLAGTVAVAGLAAALTTASVAAPGDTAAHLGDVLPGALANWQGVSGWANANHDAIVAQGFDPAAVASTTGNNCVTTDPASGAIAVGASCPAGTDVGAAVGDASGSLKIQLGDATAQAHTNDATLTFKDPTTKLFTAQEALSLVPTIRMTINNDDPNNPTDPPADYLINLQDNTIIRDPADPTSPAFWNSDNGRCTGTPPGSDCFDSLDPVLLTQYPDCALAQVRDGILGTHDSEAACPSEDPGNTPPLPDPYTGPTLVDTLSSGVVKAMRDDVRWGGTAYTMTQDLPISFGYPFAGSLVNGQTGHVQLSNVVANTWLEPLTSTTGLVSTVSTPVDVTKASLAGLLPAGAPGSAFSSTVDLSGSLSTILKPQITNQLTLDNAAQGIWIQTASGLRDGINAGLKWMNGKKPLTHINATFVNSISFTPVPTGDLGTDGVIYKNLMKLTDTKVAEWYPLLQLSGPLTLTYTPGAITSLTATDVSTKAPSQSSPSVPSSAPSTGASAWTFPSSAGNIIVTEPSATSTASSGSGFCQDMADTYAALEPLAENIDPSSGPALRAVGADFARIAAASDTPAEAVAPLTTVANSMTTLASLLDNMDQAGLKEFSQGQGAADMETALQTLGPIVQATCKVESSSESPAPSDSTANSATAPSTDSSAPNTVVSSDVPSSPAGSSPASPSSPAASSPGSPSSPAASTSASKSSSGASSPASPSSPAASTSASKSSSGASTPASPSSPAGSTSASKSSSSASTPASPSSPGASASTASSPSTPAGSSPSGSTPPDNTFCPVANSAYQQAFDLLTAVANGDTSAAVPAKWTAAGTALQAAVGAPGTPAAAVAPLVTTADWFTRMGVALGSQDQTLLDGLFSEIQSVQTAFTQLSDVFNSTCLTTASSATPGKTTSASGNSTPAGSSSAPSTPASSSPAGASTTAPSGPATTTPAGSSTAHSSQTPSTPSSAATSPSSPAPTTPAGNSTTAPSSPAHTTPTNGTTAPSSPAHTTPGGNSTTAPSSPAGASTTAPSVTSPASSTTTPTTPPASTTEPKKVSVVVSPANPTLTLVNGQLPAPVEMTATGTGFQPGEQVSAVMYSDPLPLDPAQTADPAGSVTFTWLLPADITAGQHTVVMTGDITGPVDAASFTVTRVDATPSATGPATAGTTAPTDTITVTQSGTTLTVKGTGFKPGDPVTATVVKVTGSTTTPVASLTAAVADANGNVAFTWTIPAGTASGTYGITLTGPDGSSQSKQFTLTAAKDGSVTLAGTGPGPETNVVGVLGLLAIALGVSFVLVPTLQRRRRNHVN